MTAVPRAAPGPVIGVLLAAGASKRFGTQDKLLHPVGDRPLLHWSARALLSSGCDRVLAVVSSDRVAEAMPVGIQPISIAPGLPMAQSFQAAIAAARQEGAARLLIALADMPGISAALLRRLLDLSGDAACQCDGRRLPPVVLSAASFDRAMKLAQGDRGARALIANLPSSQILPIPASAALDVDRPEDLDGLNAPG